MGAEWLKPMKKLKYPNLGNNIIKDFEPIMAFMSRENITERQQI